MAAAEQLVVLIRHGETAWTLTGQHTGRTDLPLLEDRVAALEPLRDRLCEWDFARVLASPLQRAFETARIAGLEDGAEKKDELMEWHYGAYEGLTTAQIQERAPGWSLWTDGAPDGETTAQVSERVDRVIAEIRSGEGPVAVFSHGHLLRTLAARWLGLPVAFGRQLALGTASVSVLGMKDGQPVLTLWNDRTHLAAPTAPQTA